MKILIISKRMHSGGVEISLLNLINELLKNDENNVKLLLERKEGTYLKDISSKVEIEELSFTKPFYNIFIDSKIASTIIKRKYLFKYYIVKAINKISTKFKLRENFEKFLLDKTIKSDEYYDLAIDFHGYGHFLTKYVANNVRAGKKVMFVHDEKIDWMENIKNYMNSYDKFFCVSKYVKNVFVKKYSQYENKCDVFYNIIDECKIKLQAKQNNDIGKEEGKTILMTIGRLEMQKGYDLLIDIAKELRKKRYNFVWYIIGIGSLEKDIKKIIYEENLSKNVILLGMKKNPYTYLNTCDIYIQPSRHEGFGIAICEAKILDKPIIATNLEPIREQIDDEINGFLCKFDKNDFIKKIEMLINDKNKRKKIINNLQQFKYDKNDIYKLYDLCR